MYFKNTIYVKPVGADKSAVSAINRPLRVLFGSLNILYELLCALQ